MSQPEPTRTYRGRLAPSPTGYLHLGHARTFWVAQERARAQGGILVLRNEDLDANRCKIDFTAPMIEDLKWFGFDWQEGPDCGGPFGPYAQSARRPLYLASMRKLLEGGFIYPCVCSRQDVLRALQAPHQGEDGPVYPGTCRPERRSRSEVQNPGSYWDLPPFGEHLPDDSDAVRGHEPGAACSPAFRLPVGGPNAPRQPKGCTTNGRVTGRVPSAGPRINWRFRVPDGEAITFVDGHCGSQQFVAGGDLGDFVVWRHDGVPSYQLAVVTDDLAMRITEVVRGADLLKSTARQILLYRALGANLPAFYHCPLLTDATGLRLAKRHDALSLRRLREQGQTPDSLRSAFALDHVSPATF